MNRKNISRHLRDKIDFWCESISDNKVISAIRNDAIITGGALVSLLNGETPNDYDIYFKTKESCKLVAEYYANILSVSNEYPIEVVEKDDRIMVEIPDTGSCKNDEISIKCPKCGFVYTTTRDELDIDKVDCQEFGCGCSYFQKENICKTEGKYRPEFFSTNAITLSDKIQLVIRFYGDIDEIHSNYDFVHCTCSYDYKNNTVKLPEQALESIINKELIYSGSKYPLCSIVRTRKFINRGWTINAGQYLKMCMQLNDLDLRNRDVLKEQLVGVDSAFF